LTDRQTKQAMQNFNQREYHSPHLAWREQTQARVTELLANGREQVCDITGSEWQILKTKWQAFIRAQCKRVTQYQGEPISAQMIKETKFDGFRVQNIVFDSMPGWQVGLNLFLPVTDGPYVPIICPCGHGPKWQDDHQLPSQVLARNGFAVALFDMPMFGEKVHHNDHFIQGSQAGMVGVWSNHFFLIDAIRSADYLQTRPDIDFSHGMGVTGVSGGGFATLFMAQIDARTRAIAPVCSVAPFGGHVIVGLYTGCPENYMDGQAALGLDFDHMLCLAAPLPSLVMGGTDDDLFRPAQVQASVDQARLIFDLERVPDRLSLFIDDSPHKYTPAMAFQAARWMRRWLLGNDSVVAGFAPELLPESDLNCGTAETTCGMLHFIRHEVTRLKQNRKPDVSNASLLVLAGLDQSAIKPVLSIEKLPAARWGYPWLRNYAIHSANDLSLPAIEAKYPDAPAGTIVCFGQGEKTSHLHQNGGLFGLRRQIIAADLRGFGDLAPQPADYDLYRWCGVDRALSDLVQLAGETVVGQQARDALRVIEMADSAQDQEPQDIIVLGVGEAALPALFAGLLHPRVKHIVLDSFLCSFETLAISPAPAWSRYQYIPHVLQHFDLPELFARRDDKRFLLINPCGPDLRRLDEVDALRLYGLDSAHITVHVDYDTPFDKGFYPNQDHPSASTTIRDWLERQNHGPLSVDPVLAVHGGQPVRQKPLPTKTLGADLTGLNELYQAQAVIGTKTLFRHYGIGKPVMAETLENRIREKFGARYALAVTSRSAALICALAGLGLGPGDEVILPAFSWFSCYNAVALLGALPVFCDIDRSLDIDPADFERKITARTKAVIAVHYQGSPADMRRILEIAHRAGVRVLEDCAQAIGARYHGQAVGTVGDVGVFSLQGNKVITCGEGGIVITSDQAVFERAVRFHDLGFLRPVFKAQLEAAPITTEFTGGQYRMNEITAAVALAQLDKLDWIIGRTHRSWCLLRNRLAQTAPALALRQSHDEDGDAGITLYLDLQTPARAKVFAAALEAEGIPLGPSSGMTNLLAHEYIKGKHMLHPTSPPFGPGYPGEHVVYSTQQAPHAGELVDSMVAVGIGPRFTARDVEDVAQAITKVWQALDKGTLVHG
jgi:8-amino-3,8-dideoxy-alpha-D-manno-octulosonate transaminase